MFWCEHDWRNAYMLTLWLNRWNCFGWFFDWNRIWGFYWIPIWDRRLPMQSWMQSCLESKYWNLQSKNAARSGKFSDCCFRSKVLIRCRQQKVASKVNLSGRLLFVLEWKEAGKGWTSTASLKIISFTRTEERRGIPAKIFSSHSQGDSKIGSSLRVLLLWWEPLRTMWINWRTFQLWMEFAGFSSGGQSNQIDTLLFVTNFMNILNMRIPWPVQWSFS